MPSKLIIEVGQHPNDTRVHVQEDHDPSAELPREPVFIGLIQRIEVDLTRDANRVVVTWPSNDWVSRCTPETQARLQEYQRLMAPFVSPPPLPPEPREPSPTFWERLLEDT